jgi:CDP-diacylglycerol--serine O-phosphatidyltransferase
MNYRRIVPNSISGLSLVFGVLSIFLSMEKSFFWAAVLIILAVGADSCDGRAARLLHCSGDFGIQLDSLCDVCSFGVAPAILIYIYGMQDLGLAGQVVASLFTFGGAMRLARFNTNVSAIHGYFQGMPIPGGACVLATYVISGYNNSSIVVAILTLAIAIIMYSDVRFPDFKGKGNPLFKGPVILSLLVGIYMLVSNLKALHAIPFICMFTYTFCGIINAVYVKVFHKTYSV